MGQPGDFPDSTENPRLYARQSSVVATAQMAFTVEANMLDNSGHTTANLQANVACELDWDPKVDSRDIAVTVHGGAVTLRGTVSTLRQVREAQHATRRVFGVTSVSNCLQVRSINSGYAEDREIRTAVVQALMLNSSVPGTVSADVQNSVVCLTGTATWHCQREEAERTCAAVAGVLGIADEIELTPDRAETSIQQAIVAAFRRNAHLAIHDLSVDVLGPGVAILSGTLTSWAEHDEALAAAWSACGVARVEDRIMVIY
jgi:osmotically-inducible protein OsmY